MAHKVKYSDCFMKTMEYGCDKQQVEKFVADNFPKKDFIDFDRQHLLDNRQKEIKHLTRN